MWMDVDGCGWMWMDVDGRGWIGWIGWTSQNHLNEELGTLGWGRSQGGSVGCKTRFEEGNVGHGCMELGPDLGLLYLEHFHNLGGKDDGRDVSGDRGVAFAEQVDLLLQIGRRRRRPRVGRGYSRERRSALWIAGVGVGRWWRWKRGWRKRRRAFRVDS